MRVLVLGATGATGRELVRRAIDDGLRVTAVVRSAAALNERSDVLDVIEGNVTSAELLDAVVPGHDAVVSVLGTRRSLRGLGSMHLMTPAMEALLPAMERHGVQRLIVLSALGVGETADLAPRSLRLTFKTIFRAVGGDKAASEARIRGSALDWTLVYPPVLSNGPPSGGVLHGADLRVRRLRKITRADLVQFLLEQLRDGQYSRSNVIVSS